MTFKSASQVEADKPRVGKGDQPSVQVYALITAHLGTVIMNHREMSQPWVRVGVVSVTAATDVGVYVYQAAVVGGPARPVSYPAHLAGAGAGLLVGVLCLRNLQVSCQHPLELSTNLREV